MSGDSSLLLPLGPLIIVYVPGLILPVSFKDEPLDGSSFMQDHNDTVGAMIKVL